MIQWYSACVVTTLGVALTLSLPAGAADLRLAPPAGVERAVAVKKPAIVAPGRKVGPSGLPVKVALNQDAGGYPGWRGFGLILGVGF